MFSSVINARRIVLCQASDNKPKSKTFEKSKKVFNDFHKKRTETFKLNSNEFVKVSQNELNEVNAFIKELDVFHKEQFDEIKNHIQVGIDSIRKKAEPKKEAIDDEVTVEVVAEADENIFLKKD